MPTDDLAAMFRSGAAPFTAAPRGTAAQEARLEKQRKQWIANGGQSTRSE